MIFQHSCQYLRLSTVSAVWSWVVPNLISDITRVSAWNVRYPHQAQPHSQFSYSTPNYHHPHSHPTPNPSTYIHPQKTTAPMCYVMCAPLAPLAPSTASVVDRVYILQRVNVFQIVLHRHSHTMIKHAHSVLLIASSATTCMTILA